MVPSDIEISRNQQHKADKQADEREQSHCRWGTNPFWAASRGVALLPPKEESPSGESQRSKHQKHFTIWLGEGRDHSQPCGAEAQTDQK